MKTVKLLALAAPAVNASTFVSSSVDAITVTAYVTVAPSSCDTALLSSPSVPAVPGLASSAIQPSIPVVTSSASIVASTVINPPSSAEQQSTYAVPSPSSNVESSIKITTSTPTSSTMTSTATSSVINSITPSSSAPPAITNGAAAYGNINFKTAAIGIGLLLPQLLAGFV